MARYLTAGDIVNRVAVELGLIQTKLADPYAPTTNAAIVQLRELLNVAGDELVTMHGWEAMVRSYQITTASTDSGAYPLPEDFSYMVDQTGWERNNRVPLGGPLSAQDWAYLQGRGLASNTIYASFRMAQSMFQIYPNDPVPDGLDINFQYQSRAWVADSTNPGQFINNPNVSADTIIFEPILISRYTKLKFLIAKQLDATAAQDDFNQLFLSWTGKDSGAEVLNAGCGRSRFPYLDPYANVGDSNYGSTLP